MAHTIKALGWHLRRRSGWLTVRDGEGGYRRVEVRLGQIAGTRRLLLVLDGQPPLVLTALQGGWLRRSMRDVLQEMCGEPGAES